MNKEVQPSSYYELKFKVGVKWYRGYYEHLWGGHFVLLLGGLNIFRVKHILIGMKCRNGITPNVFGLCVSLPLHKCSNYRQKLIGQIAQNPCYTLFVLIFCAVGINH
ncbi:MAG: hypothetical protein EKK63_15740 [Acinetobacter sp.]|uniref:hypothetical protein n=1 Tax=Acinetobacter sp. TaxID=472 RepID=UPI000F93AE21|nr:hypothetical protein [Acinetobacter sp.]RUP37021.1 MAG: hypothetical protein EKK63_15740 [Acinetobacter sp.]